MSAIDTRMRNWKSDWKFMEQPEKDLYLAVEKELAELRAVVGVMKDARIALTFYREWMCRHDGGVAYPFGVAVEHELAAALARVDGEK